MAKAERVSVAERKVNRLTQKLPGHQEIVVGRCVVCNATVWAFAEFGLVWLVDPRAVNDWERQEVEELDIQVITVSHRGTATPANASSPRKLHRFHPHQRGVQNVKYQPSRWPTGETPVGPVPF